MTGNLIRQDNTYIGEGAPVTGDEITTNTALCGLNTFYIDKTNGASYVRTGVGKVTGDWTQIGSSGTSLQSATVTLTDAQIKALPTTPIEIIAAQGSGKGIIIVSALAKLDSSGGAYGNVGSVFLVLQASSLPFNVKQINIRGVGLDDSAGVYYGYASPFDDNNYAQPSWIDNVGISIASQNTGDFTGGNAANTLTITTYYIVVDL